MTRPCHRSAAISVHCNTAVNRVKSAPKDGRVCRPKHVQQIQYIDKKINKRKFCILLFAYIVVLMMHGLTNVEFENQFKIMFLVGT